MARPKTIKYCEEHQYWKGGRTIDVHGYVRVLLKPDDPYIQMANHKRYVLEHRLIMAKYLGRCLLKSELVHHKNGLIANNRLENLELSNRSSHATFHIMQLPARERQGRASKMLISRWKPTSAE